MNRQILLKICLVGTLLFSLAAAANDCTVLESRIQVPADVPRVGVSNANLYDLLENKFTPEHPLTVLTLNGEEYLLAFDARRAWNMGPKQFLDHFLQLTEDSGSQAWRAKVLSRFAQYDSEFFEVTSIASLVGDKSGSAQILKSIEAIFFLRFLNTSLSTNRVHRPQFFVSPEKEDRLALVSLRIPKPVIYRDPRGIRTTSKVPPPMYQSQALKPPANVLLQLPPEDGKPVFVVKETSDAIENSRLNGFRRLIEFTAGRVREKLGEDRFLLSQAFHRPKDNVSGYIWDLEYSEETQFNLIKVKSVTPATVQELMALDADFIEQFTEHSRHFELFDVPHSLGHLYMYRSLALENSIAILMAQKGEQLKQALEHLAPGFRYAIATDPIDATNYEKWKPKIRRLPRIVNARLLQFTKEASGRVILSSIYERPPLE